VQRQSRNVRSIPFADTFLVSKQISKGSRLLIVLNVNKHPFEIINYGTGKDVNDETINDAKEPLRIKWYTDSYLKIPISRAGASASSRP
jgi:hypothetical protein